MIAQLVNPEPWAEKKERGKTQFAKCSGKQWLKSHIFESQAVLCKPDVAIVTALETKW